MVQQFCKSITGLVFFLFAAAASGQPAKPPITFKPDAPDRYIVVPGDTLWGIAERFTDAPWRWSELWGLNKDEIRNPHRIYPGNVIVLDRSKGQLALGSGPSETVKLSPRTRSDRVSAAGIPSIPASVIEPFLIRPLVVEPDGMDKAPTIVGSQGDRVILSTGSVAYVRGIGDSKEQTWYVYRRGNALVDPDSNQTLGYEAIYLGTAQVTRPGDPATIVLTSAVQEVGAGDKLVAAGRAQAIDYAPRPAAASLKGRVVSIYGAGRVGEAGPQSIVTINRGRSDGVEVGHVVALYNQGGTARDRYRGNSPEATIKLPDERAGLAFVFRTFDRISYALVMQISKPINALDVVQAP